VALSATTLGDMARAREREGPLAKAAALKPVAAAPHAPGLLVWMRPKGLEFFLPEEGRRQAAFLVRMFTLNIDHLLLTARAEPDVLRVRVELGYVREDATEALVRTIIGMLSQRRRQGGEAQCRQRLMQLAKPLAAYASSHRGRLPDKLDKIVAPPKVPRSLLKCPTRGTFLYPGRNMKSSVPKPERRIVACCPGPHRRGTRNVLFLDWHLAAQPERQVAAMLKKFRVARKKTDVEKIKGFRWKRKDPHAPDVLWAGYDWGVARNSKDGAQEFRNLLGEARPGATSIAFTRDAVWLGTERGLFRWDRAKRFWARMAVRREHFTANVKSLELKGARLTVTAEVGGRTQPSIYDLDKRRWQ